MSRSSGHYGEAAEGTRAGLGGGIPKVPKLRSRAIKVFGAIEVAHHRFTHGEIETLPFKGPVVNLHLSTPHRLVQRQDAKKITLSATDPDNDALTYKVTSLPTNATLYIGDATDPANQTEANKVVVNTPLPGAEVTYVPNANYNSTSANPDTFSFLANDGMADSVEATVSVTVTAVNDSPKISVLAGSASQSACLSNTSGRLTLKLSDVDSNLSDLKLSSTTTNTSTKSPLVPNSRVSFGGTGGTRTATISTVPGRTGTSTVTITATDDKLAGGSVDVGVKAGGNGNDTLSGTSGADLLLGQNGDDRLSASGGNDVLCGANGNDRLSGGAGSDTFDGGSGTDAATDYNAAAADSRTNIP